MGSTDLALSWKDHHGVLFNVFEKLLAKKSLVDCTLAAEGKFLKAHRIVLSACSPYFEALLDQEHDKHPIIFLRDVQFEDLKTLLEFVYSGEIKIPENRLVEFLNVAEALQIKGLGGVGNEGQVNKSLTDVLPQRETRSPVPRKRTRRHSSSSDGSSRDRAEIIPVSSESSRPKSNSEKIVPVANNASTSEPVPRQTSVVPSEDLNPNVKVKEEIITPVQSTCSDLLSSDQSADNEEILGLKPEFEQVTFTEDYSDDMLPEDSDSVDHVIDQDQPSSSQQYSGFSAESAKAGELSIHPPFAVGGVNQPVPEGFNVREEMFDAFNSGNKGSVIRFAGLENGYKTLLQKTPCSTLVDSECVTGSPGASCVSRNDGHQPHIQETKCDPQGRRALRGKVQGTPCSPSTSEKYATVVQNVTCVSHGGENSLRSEEAISYSHVSKEWKGVEPSSLLSGNINTTSIGKATSIPHDGEKPKLRTQETVHDSLVKEEQPVKFKETLCPPLAEAVSGKSFLVGRGKNKNKGKVQCSLCLKYFFGLPHLRNHLNIHTGERPHRCTLCESAFADPANLRRHVRLKHTLRDNTRVQAHFRMFFNRSSPGCSSKATKDE